MDQREMFQELTARRRSDARALDSYTFQGVKASVVEKYTDQAHFIYELLQNADDVEATTARLILYEDRLVFAHDGIRRFSVTDPDTEKEDQVQQTLGDINAICAIGGIRLNGGNFTAVGFFCGAWILTMIRNGLTMMNVDIYYEQAFLGAIILLAVSLESLRLKMAEQMK